MCCSKIATKQNIKKEKLEEYEYNVFDGFTLNWCQSPVPRIPPKIHFLKTDMLEYIVVCQLKKLCGLCQGTI